MPQDPAAAVSQRYDRDAAAHRELWAPLLRRAGRGLLRELAGTPARRVLDVGTGVGARLPDLRAAFRPTLVVGVDRSRGMLALAPRDDPLLVMDATRLALGPESVDLVLLSFVLFHLEAPLAGLREARRVLRPGGRVGSLTWARELDSGASRLWAECLDAHGAAPADLLPGTRHDLVDAPERMAALLAAAGFTSVRSWAEDLVQSIDLEHLLRLRTGMGSWRARFESLAPEAREACVAEARRRMERLAPEEFLARGAVVCALAAV